MSHVIYFRDFFESIPDYRKLVLIIFFQIKNDDIFLQECGFLKSDNDSLTKEFKNVFIIEQIEEFLSGIKNAGESIIEKFLNKKMEDYFSELFENIYYERSLIILLSLTDPDELRQSRFTDDEMEITKNLDLEK